MFKFGNKNQIVTPDTVPQQPNKRLILHVGTMGWQASMLDGEGNLIGQPLHGNASGLDLQGQERIEKIIHQAMEDLGRGILKESDAIYVLLDGCPMVFSDSKQEGLRAASDATARMFGQRLLNAPTTQSVTFGMAPFGPALSQQEAAAGEEEGGSTIRRPMVYAFADVRQIRAVLSLFDISALKVLGLTPTSYAILRQAASQPDQTYGAMFFGSHETTLILAHHNHHGSLVRTIPVGILSLAQSVAEKAGISLADAMEALSKRDLVAKITPDNPNEQTLATNPYQAGLEPGLRQILADLVESLDYFMAQRVCGKPYQLECFGDFARINGLDRWLAKHSQLDLVPAGKTLLNLFSPFCTNDECNLLRGAETSLISVGKVKYSFTKSGFVKTSTLATQSQSLDATKAHGSQQRRRSGTPSGRRRSQEKDQAASGGLLQNLLASLRKKTAAGDEAGESAQLDVRQGAALLVLLGALALYWGYDQVTVQKKQYLSRVNGYLKARDTNTSQLKDAIGNKIGLGSEQGEELNKVFWTDKFIAISQAMNQHIWLTDLYLASAQLELAGAKVETKKLVLEGAVLPSWDGHIGRMADFLGDLSDQSKNSFMNDFRQITFRGSTLDRQDDVVRFGFEAWYDRNKRVEEQKKKLESGDLPGNLDAIRDSTKAKEDALRPKVK